MKVFVKLFTSLNLGDDLFLKILLERYPTIEFVVPAPNVYKKVFGEYKNLNIIRNPYNQHKAFYYKVLSSLERTLFPKSYVLRIEKKARQMASNKNHKADAFLAIGGSIFMQPRTLPIYFDIEYYKMVKKYFKNTFFIGCNFGPFKNIEYKKGFSEVFSEANDVCFREKYSWELFSELENVRCKPDVVFGLEVPAYKKKPGTVGFSIITPRNKVNKKKYIKKYAELIEFYRSKGYEVFLFSFCKTQGDELIINSIVDLLKETSGINKVFYSGNIAEFLRIYGSVEKMYCGRFHAMILSMLFDQFIFPVIYSEKMTNVLHDIEYEGDIISLDKFAEINPELLFKQMELNKYNITHIRKNGREQFAKLDLFIKE